MSVTSPPLDLTSLHRPIARLSPPPPLPPPIEDVRSDHEREIASLKQDIELSLHYHNELESNFANIVHENRTLRSRVNHLEKKLESESREKVRLKESNSELTKFFHASVVRLEELESEIIENETEKNEYVRSLEKTLTEERNDREQTLKQVASTIDSLVGFTFRVEEVVPEEVLGGRQPPDPGELESPDLGRLRRRPRIGLDGLSGSSSDPSQKGALAKIIFERMQDDLNTKIRHLEKGVDVFGRLVKRNAAKRNRVHRGSRRIRMRSGGGRGSGRGPIRNDDQEERTHDWCMTVIDEISKVFKHAELYNELIESRLALRDAVSKNHSLALKVGEIEKELIDCRHSLWLLQRHSPSKNDVLSGVPSGFKQENSRHWLSSQDPRTSGLDSPGKLDSNS